MPLYLCSIPATTLDDERRQRIAAGITRVHCDVTGAPALFAHVVFRDAEPGQYMVFGSIRAGRSDEVKNALRKQMAAAVAAVVGVDAQQVVVFTKDVPASWVMEGGALLPEPGEEDGWLAAQDQGAR
jgi:phenylpyruvate tautomerase PptA (4-oxalocrotonate tautomerase family)